MQRIKLCVTLHFDAFFMRTYDKKWKTDFEDIEKEIH